MMQSVDQTVVWSYQYRYLEWDKAFELVYCKWFICSRIMQALSDHEIYILQKDEISELQIS